MTKSGTDCNISSKVIRMGFSEFWLLMYVLLRNSVYGPIGFVPPGVINIYLSIYLVKYAS